MVTATDRWAGLFGAGPVVVDGGLSTQLASHGAGMPGRLWTARALLDDPEAVTRAHAAFVEAGATVVITASYQVSRQGFRAEGLAQSQADAALAASVAVARRAADRGGPGDAPVRVAASVGPYGAIRHDGSEYRGRYGLAHEDLVDFHRPRLEVLAASTPDLFAVETIPDVDEARAIVEALEAVPGVPAWMTFSAADEARTCAGQPIEEAVRVAAGSPSIVAVGINCTDPRHVLALVARVRAACDLPVVVYPNAGGRWDAATGAWSGEVAQGGVFADDLVLSWRTAGATAIGGCCGTDDRSIRQVARVLAGTAPG